MTAATDLPPRVAAAMGTITCARYCELVGISSSTLGRWVREHVLRPGGGVGPRGGPASSFTAEDVDFGRELRAYLRRYSGGVTLIAAATAVRYLRLQHADWAAGRTMSPETEQALDAWIAADPRCTRAPTEWGPVAPAAIPGRAGGTRPAS